MVERIRYSVGASALGDFVAAFSDHGLTAFEFLDGSVSARELLADRLVGALFEEDQPGLAERVGKLAVLVDYPAAGPDIALDPRGSDYQKRVWALLREIPAGQTTSYGALAAKLGTRDARDVTAAIASNGIAILIPCHRVVKKDGSLSGYRWGARRKRILLDREREAVAFALT